MRIPRFTFVSEGKPLRRLLVGSKAVGLSMWVFSHGDASRKYVKDTTYKGAQVAAIVPLYVVVGHHSLSERPATVAR